MRSALGILAAVSLCCCGFAQVTSNKAAKSSATEQLKCPPGPSVMAIESGEYSMFRGTTMSLHRLRATMTPRGKSVPVCLARDTHIEAGHVSISAESLSKLFSAKLAASPKSSISDLKVETSPNTLKISGKIKKILPLPFSIEGPVSSDGRTLQVKTEKIKMIGIPAKAIMDAVGIELGGLLGANSPKGITATEDTLNFDPQEIFHMTGKITHAAIDGGALVVDFGSSSPKQQALARPGR